MNVVKFITKTFPTFLGKYADEISIVGTVLSRLLWGKSLSNGERDDLQRGLNALIEAGENIRSSIEQFSRVDIDGVLDDVKKNAEEMLAEMRDEFRKLLEQAPSPDAVTALEKRVAELEVVATAPETKAADKAPAKK